MNDSKKQSRIDRCEALRVGERQPSPGQLAVPGGMEVTEVLNIRTPNYGLPLVPHRALGDIAQWAPWHVKSRTGHGAINTFLILLQGE